MRNISFGKKLFQLFLSVCLVLPIVPSATAVTIDTPPDEAEVYYIGTYSTSASIDISSNGVADCWGHVDCYPGYTADAVMRLQWKDSYGVWLDYASWYDEGNAANFSWSCVVPKGRTYRVRVVADIYDSDGNKVEVVDAVSGSCKY